MKSSIQLRQLADALESHEPIHWINPDMPSILRDIATRMDFHIRAFGVEDIGMPKDHNGESLEVWQRRAEALYSLLEDAEVLDVKYKSDRAFREKMRRVIALRNVYAHRIETPNRGPEVLVWSPDPFPRTMLPTPTQKEVPNAGGDSSND
jgi:hypothetical protein